MANRETGSIKRQPYRAREGSCEQAQSASEGQHHRRSSRLSRPLARRPLQFPNITACQVKMKTHILEKIETDYGTNFWKIFGVPAVSFPELNDGSSSPSDLADPADL